MSHDMKLRIKSGLLALMVAGGITLVHAPKAMAEEAKPKYKEGTFIDIPSFDEHEESQYGIYVVKEGDNLSKISEKICRHQGVEISTKYWPVLAYLNGYPKVAQPGDLLFFSTDGSGGVSHVGIYVGNGQMVHVSSSKNSVISTSINTSYWQKAYIRAKRVL